MFLVCATLFLFLLSPDPIRYKRDVKVKLNYSIEFAGQSYCFILISDMEYTLDLLQHYSYSHSNSYKSFHC